MIGTRSRHDQKPDASACAFGAAGRHRVGLGFELGRRGLRVDQREHAQSPGAVALAREQPAGAFRQRQTHEAYR